MADIGADPFENTVKDISVCPECGHDIHYHYRLYRHIGDFYCDSCDFRTPDAKYFAEAVDYDTKEMTVREEGETTAYPLISDTVFNAFNVLSYIALMRELGFAKQELVDFLKTQRVTKIRETSVKFNGIEYLTYAAKSQNVSAASTVFEYMAKEPSIKEVVLLLDEVQDRNHPSETVTWLYETDYEFLNSPNIKKIIVGGHMYLNHKPVSYTHLDVYKRQVYDDPVGVLTNNPPFPVQLFALNNYAGVSRKQPENPFAGTLKLDAYSRGMGAMGIPGDLSSQSRFVKAAFTKLSSVSGDSEKESVSQFFHILGSVDQQRGCCEVGDGKYEITIYTSCCNADKGIYYYTTYDLSLIHI